MHLQINGDRNFISDLQLTYGPTNMLGQFFLQAYSAVLERGVELSFASFGELMQINEMNLKSWRPLTSVFSIGDGGIDDENGICIVGRDANGDVVATQAVRFYQWEDTNFRAEAETLRLFYASPEDSKAPGETCSVSAPSAEKIKGRVGYGGAIWYRPDYRGGLLSTIMPRIGRVYAYSKWKTDFVVAIMTEQTVNSGFTKRIGYRNVEWDVRRTNVPSFAAETQFLRLGLAIANVDDLLDDVFGYLLSANSESDSWIEQSHAHDTRQRAVQR